MNTKYYLFFAFIVILLVACNAESTVQPTLTPTSVPTASKTSTPTPTLTPTVPGPTTVYISSDGSGDYATLAMAIESVAAESTIILDEGTFHLEESLEIDKPLTFEGAGSDKTIVTGEGPVSVVRYTGDGLFIIRGITFRRDGDLAASVMVILNGEVDFSNCRFTNGAPNEDKTISGVGLIFLNHSAGIVKDCEVDANSENGIIVVGHAKPEMISNYIHDNGKSGIYYQLDENGGLAELNDLKGNGFAGFGGGNGNDIFVSGSFAPSLISNKCSLEGPRFGSSDLGDSSGIEFLSRKGRAGLPAENVIEDNDCAVNWCSTESGSLLVDFTCRSNR